MEPAPIASEEEYDIFPDLSTFAKGTQTAGSTPVSHGINETHPVAPQPRPTDVPHADAPASPNVSDHPPASMMPAQPNDGPVYTTDNPQRSSRAPATTTQMEESHDYEAREVSARASREQWAMDNARPWNSDAEAAAAIFSAM